MLDLPLPLYPSSDPRRIQAALTLKQCFSLRRMGEDLALRYCYGVFVDPHVSLECCQHVLQVDLNHKGFRLVSNWPNCMILLHHEALSSHWGLPTSRVGTYAGLLQAEAQQVKHAGAIRYPRADLLQKSYTSKVRVLSILKNALTPTLHRHRHLKVTACTFPPQARRQRSHLQHVLKDKESHRLL